MAKWHYKNGTEPIGPIEQDELEQLIIDGQVDQDSKIWTKDFGDDWRHVGETDFAEFLPPLAAEEPEINSDTLPGVPPVEEDLPNESTEDSTPPEKPTPPKESTEEPAPPKEAAKKPSEDALPKYEAPSQDHGQSSTKPKLKAILEEALNASTHAKLAKIGAGLYAAVLLLQFFLLFWFTGLHLFPSLLILAQISLAVPFIIGRITDLFPYAIGVGLAVMTLAMAGQLGISSDAVEFVDQAQLSIMEDIDDLDQSHKLAKLKMKRANYLADEEKNDAEEMEKEIKEIENDVAKPSNDLEIKALRAELSYVQLKSRGDKLKLQKWRSINGFLIIGVFLMVLGSWYQRQSQLKS